MNILAAFLMRKIRKESQMDSLYGGKPGNPFVIKQAFPTIEAMVAEFAKGAGSNKV